MGSGRGIKSTGNMAASLPGVLNGQISEYSLENVDQKLQVFLFYPGDWSDQSQVFLSSFSSVTGGLGREDCLVYGVSSDTVNDHQDWISSSNINPSFPLISDTAGLLATKYGLYTTREEGEEEQVEGEFARPPCWSWSTPASPRRSCSLTPRTDWTCWSRRDCLVMVMEQHKMYYI